MSRVVKSWGTLLRMTLRSERQKPFEEVLLEQTTAERCAREFLDDLLTNCAEIVHTNYLQTQIKPYAARTIAQELIMNASWAKLCVGPQIFGIVPDDDLEIPRVDQWCNGALTVEDPATVQLRSSICEFREPEKQGKPRRAADDRTISLTQISSQSSFIQSGIFAARKPANTVKAKQEPNAIIKMFDEAKKQQLQSGTKNVTVDAELHVIPIQEPKALNPSLIVPRVTMKKAAKQDVSPAPRRVKPKNHVTPTRRKKASSKTILPGLLEEDKPIFDEEVAQASVSDKFVCMPGVTLREGGIVKSSPSPQKVGGLTKSQYEAQSNNL